MAGILAVLEMRGNNLRKVSLELLSEGKRLAEALGVPLVGLLMGSGAGQLAQTLNNYGVTKFLVNEDPQLAQAYIVPYGRLIVQAAQDLAADVILLPASAKGKDLTAWVAGTLETSAATDCTALQVEDGKIVAVRPVYTGKALSQVTIDKKPAIFSLRPNVFAISSGEAGTVEVESIALQCEAADLAAVLKEFKPKATNRPELTEATIIVAGGRGMKDPQNFKLIEELADLLGAAVGVSRAVVDDGWRPHDEQVGQTGKTVSPNLYIACGISGAIQHLAGMSGAKVIVAINTDKDAPIFQIADYGIVGDAMEVLPRMISELKQRQT